MTTKRQIVTLIVVMAMKRGVTQIDGCHGNEETYVIPMVAMATRNI